MICKNKKANRRFIREYIQLLWERFKPRRVPWGCSADTDRSLSWSGSFEGTQGPSPETGWIVDDGFLNLGMSWHADGSHYFHETLQTGYWWILNSLPLPWANFTFIYTLHDLHPQKSSLKEKHSHSKPLYMDITGDRETLKRYIVKAKGYHHQRKAGEDQRDSCSTWIQAEGKRTTKRSQWCRSLI